VLHSTSTEFPDSLLTLPLESSRKRNPKAILQGETNCSHLLTPYLLTEPTVRSFFLPGPLGRTLPEIDQRMQEILLSPDPYRLS